MGRPWMTTKPIRTWPALLAAIAACMLASSLLLMGRAEADIYWTDNGPT